MGREVVVRASVDLERSWWTARMVVGRVVVDILVICWKLRGSLVFGSKILMWSCSVEYWIEFKEMSIWRKKLAPFIPTFSDLTPLELVGVRLFMLR